MLDGYVFEETLKAYAEGYRYIINRGGSSSGKTYGILSALITIAAASAKPLEISVISYTFPHLRKGAMRDFFKILRDNNLYNPKNHSQTNHIYKINNSFIEFFAADSYDKVLGPRRDLMYLNESVNFRHQVARDLILRCRKTVFIDYNPLFEHWVQDYESRTNAKLIKSTYRDNKHLPPQVIEEIESYKDIDEVAYKVYALGEFAASKELIYRWEVVPQPPKDVVSYIYGVDFGFNNPTAVAEIAITEDGDYYITNELYLKHLTTGDLIDLLPEFIREPSAPLYCDSAETDRITELGKHYNALPAKKNVIAGIDYLKKSKIKIVENCVNTIKEMRTYRFAKKDDVILDYPVKLDDHLMDAIRYAVYTHKNLEKIEKQFIFVKPKRTYR